MSELDDDDRARLVAWLSGELADPERGEFELRLARDPELARLAQELGALDELLQRRRAGAEGARARRRRAWGWPLALAAGLAAVLLGRALFLSGTQRAKSVELAVAASPDSARAWIEAHPALAGLRPPGLDELRGPGEAPNVGAEDYLARAAPGERSLFEALLRPEAELRAGHFVLPVRCAEECSLVVLGFPAEGRAQRLFPEREASGARLAAGEHLLPGPRLALQESAAGMQLEYRPGFLVPLGARSLHVLVASRPEGIESDLLAEIDRQLDAAGRAACGGWLEERGFQLRTFEVREP